ncbi:hypothetical protein CWI81_00940 [Idiomarina seosinensis]|uniref:Uncharacterized protein n=1 Tax=Idiomarina seosinensis TaxID=281739 RepID=A0A432ZH19_9GAMM|nr:hypothetical protein CWI81_00940 [Idiomarina seosinensis]
MCKYYVIAGIADNGIQTRFIHVDGCDKLKSSAMPMSLGELHSKLHALELARCTFHDAKLCPHCCIDNQFQNAHN